MKEPKILIVDDEPVLQRAMEIALKNEGYKLYFADNGEEGLEKFTTEKPALVFLDLKMPVMNGYDFLESIEIRPDSPFTVIVITGHGDDDEIERCFKLGINFFLKKPLSMVEICGLARRCIEINMLRAEREELITSLQEANETIRHLKSFLVLCASCKRVMDGDEEWHDLDRYIQTHTDTTVSHGICADCVSKLYPELQNDFIKKITRKKK